MIEPLDLLMLVIRPTHTYLSLDQRGADTLSLGTACAESDCGRNLKQIGGGPALGPWQMEPGMTGYEDIWVNYLEFRPELREKVISLASRRNSQPITEPDGTITIRMPPPEELIGNLPFACAMARIKYLRVPYSIPDTLPRQAAYWKEYYNTPAGKGSVEKYIQKWNQFIGQGGLPGVGPWA